VFCFVPSEDKKNDNPQTEPWVVAVYSTNVNLLLS